MAARRSRSTLAQLGNTIGYGVAVVSDGAAAEGLADVETIVAQDFNLEHVPITPQTFIVVATQGEGDEEALEQALQANAAYVAFVASKTKAAKVCEYLKTRGVSPEKLSQVRAPAGLDIGARSPEEIAVSILAEIIQTARERCEGRGATQEQRRSPGDQCQRKGPHLRNDRGQSQCQVQGGIPGKDVLLLLRRLQTDL